VAGVPKATSQSAMSKAKSALCLIVVHFTANLETILEKPSDVVDSTFHCRIEPTIKDHPVALLLVLLR